MCKLCEALKQGREIEWYQRTTSSLDNSCEYTNCDECDGCKHRFTIRRVAGSNDTYITLSYFQSVGAGEDASVVDVNSESMLWAYCPVCGSKLSKEEYTDDKIPYPLEIMKERR